MHNSNSTFECSPWRKHFLSKKESGNIFESLNTPFSYYPMFFHNCILSLEMYLVFNLIRTVTKREKNVSFIKTGKM